MPQLSEGPSLEETIEEIKQLECIDTRAKLELVLILLGEKPTSEMSVITDNDEKTAKELKNTLIGMNFECDLSSRTLEGVDNSVVHIWELKVARNSDDLQNLLTTQDPKMFGRLYGFPDTATNEFLKEQAGEPARLLCLGELPEQVQSSEYAPFCQFAFSQDHWREEIKTPQRWSEVAKQHAPELHASFLEKFRESSLKRKQLFNTYILPLLEGAACEVPQALTVVKVGSRWGHVLENPNIIRWLDTGEEEGIDWKKYSLVKKWSTEMIIGTMYQFHLFTKFELSNIRDIPNAREYAALSTRIFGEYEKA